MERKQQIEKIILKELNDRDIMKKVDRINKINEAKRSVRPTMSGKFGAQVQSDLASAKAAHGHLINPDAVPNNPIQAIKAYRNAANSSGGDAMDDSVRSDFEPQNTADAAEDVAARKALEGTPNMDGIEIPKTTREKETQARAEAKHREITNHVGELAKHIPEFAKLAKARYKTTAIFDAEPQEVTSALNSAEKTHPHLTSHIKNLRNLLGM